MNPGHLTRLAAGGLLWAGTAWGQGAAPAPTLDACVQTALREHPGVEAASRRVESARAALGQAASAYHPMVSLSADYARTDSPAQAFMMQINQRRLDMRSPTFDPNAPDDTENIHGAVNLRYRLLDGGRRTADLRAAARGVQAAEAGEAAARNELAHLVTRAYYGVLQAGAFVEVQAEAVKTLEEHVRVAGERMKAGAAVRTDLLQLEVQLAEAREQLIRARHARELAVLALRTAIGREVAGLEALQPAALPPELPPAETVTAGAVTGRPELRALEAIRQAREFAVDRARREYRPTFNLFGSLGWDADGFDDFERSYVAGVAAEWEILDGRRRAQAVRQARAEWKAAEAEERQARDGLTFELEQAAVQVRETRERVDVARRCIETAEEALRLTQERFRQGAAAVTELMTAQTGLTAARNRTVAAYYEYQVARSNLERAQGRRAAAYDEGRAARGAGRD